MLLLIDAMNLVRRIFAAQHSNTKSESGSQKSIDDTFLHCQNAILKNIERTSASHVALVFDGKGPTWRHELYSDYKAGRAPTPPDLAEQLLAFRHQIEKLGITCLLYEQFEADDVIATLASKAAQHRMPVTIVSTDKGFMQLSNEYIELYHHFEKRSLSCDDVRQTLGFGPGQLIDYLSLVGDTTNHVPGVPGVGPKTAGALLDQFADLDSILINSDSIPGKVGENIKSHFTTALLARKMVTLKLDCPLHINLSDLRYKGV